MTFQREVLRNYKEFETPESVGLGDGHDVNALGVDSIKFVSKLPNEKRVIGWIHNVQNCQIICSVSENLLRMGTTFSLD